METFKLFKIKYSNISFSDATSKLFNYVYYSPILVVTPNIDHLVRINNNHQLLHLYQASDFCFNDSRVLSLLVHWFFNVRLSCITGSDLTKFFFQSTLSSSSRICIIGSNHQQVELLKSKYDLIDRNVFHYNPSLGFIADEEETQYILNFINASKAHVTFLAVGSPQQEIIGLLAKNLVKSGLILCVGASIDYLTGKETRAPIFIRSLYLEWLFRYFQSPIKRFRRYFINCPKIFYLLVKERISKL